MDEAVGCLLAVLAIALYVAAVAAYFCFLVPVLAAAALAMAFGMVILKYGETLSRFIRRLPRKQEGAEPAIKQYFFAAAWREMPAVVDAAFDSLIESARKLGRRNAALRGKKDAALILPVMGGNYVALGVGAAGGLLVLGCLAVIHAALLSLCYSACVAAAAVLRTIEWLSMLVRRIAVVCPHEDCHRPIALPVYRCRSCGATHTALVPSSYGIVQRRCRCGTLLPTLFLFGRNRVPSFCPHKSCGKPLNTVIGTLRNIHIPIVGGPSAGKTAFLAASMLEIKRRPDVEVSFPDHAGQQHFRDVTARLGRGIPVTKTAPGSPTAFLVRMRDRKNRESLLYLYDAAGELYAGNDALQRQNYFGQSDAVALLIDPFSMKQVKVDRATELASVEHLLQVSPEPPQAVYELTVVTLREQLGGQSRIPLRLALVLTKVDAIGIDRELAALQRARTVEHNGADPLQWSVREWLCRHGERSTTSPASVTSPAARSGACLPTRTECPFNLAA
jgi:hypothetical protein